MLVFWDLCVTQNPQVKKVHLYASGGIGQVFGSYKKCNSLNKSS